ncbi:MAG: type II toxin-antitoxin system RelE/ParE family toxin [Synechococcales cyanobacterium RU_4_20]|nr:type II toxin-antitoxin system RelE/ParE family toxin [Synechococcales cyanobacterium RU_4_20]
MRKRLQTVVETPEFIRRAKEVGMTAADRADVVQTLAADPEAGVALGGGLRKVRIARRGGGNSGGFRVLHFYREEGLPLFLLTVVAKNERANITSKERAELVAICDLIAEACGRAR